MFIYGPSRPKSCYLRENFFEVSLKYFGIHSIFTLYNQCLTLPRFVPVRLVSLEFVSFLSAQSKH